jgi:protein-S-isoprenylcysteine O-methyltransferase Ste14
MVNSIIATIFLLGTAGISAAFYNHRGRIYAKGKCERISAVPGFSVVYRWVQMSTLICGIAAFWTASPLLLKMYTSATLLYVGLGVASVGLMYFVWAKLTLDTEYSPCFDSFVANRLISSGPYSRVRHPIYSGNLLLMFGIFLASGSLWIAFNFVLVAVYYVVSAEREELALLQALPGYAEYTKRTGRFIPKLFRKSQSADDS